MFWEVFAYSSSSDNICCRIETSVIPTAVLSTHTGGFTDYTFRDLTEDIMPTAEHWKSLGLEFDAIYTGYVGSIEQLEILEGVLICCAVMGQRCRRSRSWRIMECYIRIFLRNFP